MFKRIFATLLTYILGIQLIASSVPNMSFVSNISLSTNAWAGSCETGLTWNEMLGRCLTSEEAAKVQEANKQCMTLGTQQAQKDCLNKAVEARIADAEKDGTIYAHQKVDPNIVSIVLAMAGVWAGFQMSITGAGDCLMAYSKWSFIIGSVAVMAGEILSAMTYKSKMKDAEEELKKESDSSKATNSDNKTATDTQSSSFSALIKREDATISAGKTKKTLYIVAAVAHGVAMAIATYEIIAYHAQMVCPGPCGSLTIQYMCTTAAADASPPGSSPYRYYVNRDEQNAAKFVDNYFLKKQRVSYSAYSQNDSMFNEFALSIADLAIYNLESRSLQEGKNISPDLGAYTSLKKIVKENDLEIDKETITLAAVTEKLTEQFMVKSAHASGGGISLILGAAGAAGIALIQTGGVTLKKMFFSPYTRLILAGVYLANDAFMISHISKQIDKAEKRKEFIEKLQGQVTASGNAFGCTGSDRTSNTSKPNCYCYSEGGSLNPQRASSATCKAFFGGNPNLASNKKGSGTKTASTKTCMSKNGNADASCSCAKTKSCLTVTPNVKSGSVPAGLMGNLASQMNGLANGSISPADLNMDHMNGLAARAKKFQDALLSKNPSAAKSLAKAMADGRKLMASMASNIGSNPALANSSLGSGSGFGSGGSTESPSLEKMKEDLKQEIKSIDGNVVPVADGGKSKNGANDFNLDSLGSEGGVTIEDEKLAEVMGSEYDMSAGEINSDPGANIFQILSNRYQRSGMRRLFGGEAIVPADKPSETQISQ